MNTLIFMLVIVQANSFSHSYTLDGFNSFQSCQAAIQTIVPAADKLPIGFLSSTRAVCVEVKK